MYPRPDSPPPRQPSPDLIHTPLTPPRRRATQTPSPSQKLTLSRSCDGLNHAKGSRQDGGRQLTHSRSCENFPSRADKMSLETATTTDECSVGLTYGTRSRHISFQTSPANAEPLPPVPPLPAHLRNHQDDSDTEQSSDVSWDNHRRFPSIRTLSSNGSLRRKYKSPPPPPSRRGSRLASLGRLKLFSWGGSSRSGNPCGSGLNMQLVTKPD